MLIDALLLYHIQLYHLHLDNFLHPLDILLGSNYTIVVFEIVDGDCCEGVLLFYIDISFVIVHRVFELRESFALYLTV